MRASASVEGFLPKVEQRVQLLCFYVESLPTTVAVSKSVSVRLPCFIHQHGNHSGLKVKLWNVNDTNLLSQAAKFHDVVLGHCESVCSFRGRCKASCTDCLLLWVFRGGGALVSAGPRRAMGVL